MYVKIWSLSGATMKKYCSFERFRIGKYDLTWRILIRYLEHKYQLGIHRASCLVYSEGSKMKYYNYLTTNDFMLNSVKINLNLY